MPDRIPSVSIGLPVYNGGVYLRETLDDVLGQTFGDFELMICDNASTDETEAIAREVAARDPRVRYVRNDHNIGALPNANRAFALSRGHYFCLAAHDDRHTPDFLERLVAALDADPEAVLAYGRSVLVDADGARYRYNAAREVHVSPDGTRCVGFRQALERPMPDSPVERYRAVLRSNDVNAPIHGLFRREALARTGGHSLHGSDRLIVAHAALLGRFAFVDAPLFHFRLHPESTLFLDRASWAARETGRDEALSTLDTLRTFQRYWRLPARADLSAPERRAAYRATLAYAFRPDAFKRLCLPGLDNYFGWRRWPWDRRDEQQRGREEAPQPHALFRCSALDLSSA